MNATEVLETFGTRRLAAFVAALTLFLALHLVRMPFVVMARLLEAAMARVDHWVTASVSTPNTPGPGGDIRQDDTEDNAHQGRGLPTTPPHQHHTPSRRDREGGWWADDHHDANRAASTRPARCRTGPCPAGSVVADVALA